MVEEIERQKAIAWFVMSALIGLLAAAALLTCAFPLYKLFNGLDFSRSTAIWPALGALHDPGWRPGFSLRWLRDTGAYYAIGLWQYPTLWAKPLWVLLVQAPLEVWGMPHWSVMVSLAVGLLVALRVAERCPYELQRKSHGSARFATDRDIRKAAWDAKDRYVKKRGLYSPTGIVLGRAPNGRLLRMPETLSAILIAPPGSGKSAGIILPNLLADWPEYQPILGFETFGWALGRKTYCPKPTFVVNDPKGELYAKALKWLIKAGYKVIKLSLGSMDGDRWNPLGFDSLPGGREVPRTRTRILDALGRVYADPIRALEILMVEVRDRTDWVAALGADPTLGGRLVIRDEVIALEANALATWTSPARATLKDVLGDIMKLFTWQAQREQYVKRLATMAIDEKIEPHWRDKGRAALQGFSLFTIYRCEADPQLGEPSFGRLIDFMTEATKNFQPDPTAGEDQDAVASMLQAWIAEAEQRGYPARVITELASLSRTPSKERGSVLSTMEGGIDIFKVATVRSRTSASDFGLDELRFSKKPVALFIVTPLEDAVALGKITGMFFESSAARFISQDEKDIKTKGRPIIYLADEFWTLPTGMESFLQIPALGRGQWVQLLLVGQSYGQIALKINKEAVGILKSAVGAQILLQQNDSETAEAVSKAVGNYTAITANVSQTEGAGKEVKMFQWNTSRSATGLPLLPAQRLLTMRKLEEQYVLYQGMMSRPIECSSPAWFNDPVMTERLTGERPGGLARFGRFVAAMLPRTASPAPLVGAARTDDEFERAAAAAIAAAVAAQEQKVANQNAVLGQAPAGAAPPSQGSTFQPASGADFVAGDDQSRAA